MKNGIAVLLLSIFLPLASFAEAKPVTEKKQEIKTVVLAGGCFWCMQPPFDSLKAKGVISTSVGYSGGHTESPTYEQISAGGTAISGRPIFRKVDCCRRSLCTLMINLLASRRELESVV